MILEEDNIGGYVFGMLGRKPLIGDGVEIGYCFRVLKTEGFVSCVFRRKSSPNRLKRRMNRMSEEKADF